MTLVSMNTDVTAALSRHANRVDTQNKRRGVTGGVVAERTTNNDVQTSLPPADAPIVSFVPHPPAGASSHAHHNFHQPLFVERRRPTTCQAKLDTSCFQAATTATMEDDLPSAEKKAMNAKLLSPVVSRANRWRRVFSRGLSEQLAVANGQSKLLVPLRISVEGGQYASNAATSSGLSADRSPSVIIPCEGVRGSSTSPGANGASHVVGEQDEEDVWTPSGNHLAARLIPAVREEEPTKATPSAQAVHVAQRRGGQKASQSLASKIDMCAEIDDDDFDLAIASVSSYTRGSRSNKSRRPASAL